MAPSGDGQATAVAEAMAMADIPPETIGFVEAHGTGTEMGDPIEVNALAQAFQAHTQAQGFCALGSVKTNVGHLQIASGMVGFIKAVLALRHKMIPPSLHFETPNPKIDFANSPFYVNATLMPWRAADTPRRAGVNSLGIGGTNGHVVLEEAPPANILENQESGVERPHHALMLSARSDAALEELAGRYARFLADHADVSLADVCFTANTGRKPFEQRLAVAATSVAELQEDLSGVANGQLSSRVMRGQLTNQSHPPLAFLFTGQGAQYIGMGRQLYDTQPTFRHHLDQCAEILQPLLDRPLLEVMYPDDESHSQLDETVYTQPALFALEYALAQLWMSWGITPTMVMGHSLGEYVAACIAGVFSLEDGLTLVAARARLMQALPQDGQMVVVFASENALHPMLVPFAKDVAIAAKNGPEHIVISGRAQAVNELVTTLHQHGVKTQNVKTSHAFHSPLMEPMLADFVRLADQLSYTSPRIPLVSNLTGEFVSDEIASAQYWRRHIRQPVQFLAGMETLMRQGCERFIEIGPKPTLLGMAAHGANSDTGVWLPSLRQGQPEWQSMLHSLSALAVQYPVDWSGFDRDYQRRRLPLPTYPFQRQRYWLDRPAQAPRTHHAAASAAYGKRRSFGLLGHRLQLPTLQTTIYENLLNPEALPFLHDHRVFDEIVVSAACHMAMLLTAAKQTLRHSSNGAHGARGAYGVKHIYFSQPLVIPQGPEAPPLTVQVVLTPGGDQQTTVELSSFVSTDEETNPPVSTHVHGVIPSAQALHFDPATSEPLSVIWERCTEDIAVEAFFQAQADRRIDLGPSYRWMESIRRGDRETVCRLRPPAALGGLEAEPWHPGLLDACFGLLLATGVLEEGQTWLPFGIEEVRVYQDLQDHPDISLWGHLVLRPTLSATSVAADVRLCDERGQVVLEVVGLEGRPASREAIQQFLPVQTNPLLHHIAWRPTVTETVQPHASDQDQWLIFADQQGLAHRLAETLGTQGARCVLVDAGQNYRRLARDHYQANPNTPQDFERLLQESTEGQDYTGVVYLWSLDEPSVEDKDWLTHTQTLACGGTLQIVQALIKSSSSPRLWLITRGGQPLDAEASRLNIAQTSLWGLGRTVALEHPELNCTCIDLDPATDPADTTDLLASLSSPEESQIAWRHGVRHAARLVPLPTPAINGASPVRADASYLITGGTGGLGLSLATWLANQGAQHLILVSRRQASGAAAEAIAQMQQSGVQVQTLQADVSDRAALEVLFERLQSVSSGWPALRGIIHCAGIIEDGMLAEHDWQRFKTVFPSKINGAWHLHELSQDLDLDFFVLFSSAASILGNQGQSNYAAANAFLDGLAHYRQQQGLVATSINWGPWEQVGLAASDSVIQDRMQRLGLTPFSPEQGLAAFGQVLAYQVTQATVMNWDWQTYVGQLAAPHNLFSELRAQLPSVSPDQLAGVDSITAPDLLSQLRQTAPEQRRHLLTTFVYDALHQVLGMHDSVSLDPDQPLTDQGLDSLMAVQMRNAIGQGLQQVLPVSFVFNYPTVNDIVDYVETLIDNDGTTGSSHQSSNSGEQDQNLETSSVLAAKAALEELDKLLNEESK